MNTNETIRVIPTRKVILTHFERNDLKMAQIIRQIGPIQLKKNRNYFLVLSKAIIAQQISVAAADTITERLFSLFKNGSPTPSKIIGLSDSTLKGAGLSRQKVAYLKDLSDHFCKRKIRPHRFHYLDNEEIIEQLTSVYGIGRWTAEMFLIFSLNRPNVLPVGDLGLKLALKNIYGMRRLPDDKRIYSLGKKWHPLETVATWYAWRTQDGKNVAY